MSIKESQVIVDAKAVPVKEAKFGSSGGKMRQYIATVEVAAATDTNDIGDIVKMVRIPSKLVISKITVYNDDLDTNVSPTLAVDVGLYRADNGVVLDADAFAAAAATLQAANKTGVNVAWATQDIANVGKEAWEMAAGVTSDPGVPLDVALTVTAAAATGANGTITVVVEGALAN